jgi:AAA domain
MINLSFPHRDGNRTTPVARTSTGLHKARLLQWRLSAVWHQIIMLLMLLGFLIAQTAQGETIVNPFEPSHLSMADVTKAGSGLPNRCVFHGPEGSGKTSFGCCAPKPIFLMTRGETGMQTLIDAGRVPETPHFPELMTWTDLLAALDALTRDQHDHRTLVIDTVNGAERLCHEHVCQRDFDGRWGRDGFASFMTGYDSALADWRILLDALDQLRVQRRMSILLLAHTKISTFKNPEGADYDRYCVDIHHKTWSLTHRWADLVLFTNFVAFVEAKKNDTTGKAKGGSRRMIYTTRTAAYDAKNRHGLPEQIDAGRSAAEAWTNFVTALQASKQPPTLPADGQQVSHISNPNKEVS